MADCLHDRDVLREKAILYFNQNGIPKLLEDVLNNMFYDNPDDIFAYLSSSFQKYVKTPSFTRISSRPIVTAQNGRALKVMVYFAVNAKEKLMAQVNISFCAADVFCQIQDHQIINWINNDVNAAFRGCNFKNCQDIDNAISEIGNTLPIHFLLQPTKTTTEAEAKTDPRKSKHVEGGPEAYFVEEQNKKILQIKASISWGLSVAMCSAVAFLNNTPLHLYYRRLSEPISDKIPEFAITVFHNTKAAPIKLNLCSEVGIIIQAKEGLKKVVNIAQTMYEMTEKNLRQKSGATSILMTEKGAYIAPNADRLDLLLETLQDIIMSSEMLSNSDLKCFINCEVVDIYDPDKSKYEISKGSNKSSDDLVEMYMEVIKKFPSLSIVIDPFHPDDDNSWNKLSTRLEELSLTSCNVFFSSTSPNILQLAELQSTPVSSGVLIQPQLLNCVRDLTECQKSLARMNMKMIMDLSASYVEDAYLIDVAIGKQVPMVKLGGITRGERVALLNRLLEIDLEMESEEIDSSTESSSSIFTNL